jgi:hypothetical protein
MKIKNSTAWSDTFLRRLVSWCCRELEVPVRTIRTAEFKNGRRAFSGYANGRRHITVRVGGVAQFPCPAGYRDSDEVYADRIEALIAITAHEVYHLGARFVAEHQQRTRIGRNGFASGERVTRAAERKTLVAFRQEREPLLAVWSIEPVARAPSPQPSVQAKRAARVTVLLQQWQRRLKLAQGKVKKYQRKLRRYEKLAVVSVDADDKRPLNGDTSCR